MFPQDTVHAGHTLRRLSPIVHEVVADAGGSCSRDTQCLTHHEWYHTCLLVCFLQVTDISKGPPSTTIGGRRASQEGFWGGTYAKPSGPCPKRRIYLPEWRRPGMWPGGRIFGGECSPTTLVAVTTSYFSSRNFRQSLVLTLL